MDRLARRDERSSVHRDGALDTPADGTTVAGVASTPYLKRTVAQECDSLERAGVLSVRTLGNRFSFTLAKAAELEEFVGYLPAVRPDRTAMFNIARELVTAEEHMGSATLRTAGVGARSTLSRIEDDLADLSIDAPSADLTGGDLWPALKSLGDDTLGAWSVGRWEQTWTLE